MKRIAVTHHPTYDIGPYLEAARECGMDPIAITPEPGLTNLDGFAGLVLTGGTDVSPALYGQLPHAETEDPEPDRDELEQRLLREALAKNLPMLAICRGLQLLNVTLPGGTLHQHIEGHAIRPTDKSEPAHAVTVAPGTKLESILGPGKHEVNSRHHQTVDRVGDGLIISAHSDDGVIEGMELPGKRFVVAVQWHPENQIHRLPAQKNLFQAFADSL